MVDDADEWVQILYLALRVLNKVVRLDRAWRQRGTGRDKK